MFLPRQLTRFRLAGKADISGRNRFFRSHCQRATRRPYLGHFANFVAAGWVRKGHSTIGTAIA
jgi:hypothetical protein